MARAVRIGREGAIGGPYTGDFPPLYPYAIAWWDEHHRKIRPGHARKWECRLRFDKDGNLVVDSRFLYSRGDIVQSETAAGAVDYSVTKTHVVNPEDVWIVNPTDTPTATLFACHPPGSVKQRIVVNLELVD